MLRAMPHNTTARTQFTETKSTSSYWCCRLLSFVVLTPLMPWVQRQTRVDTVSDSDMLTIRFYSFCLFSCNAYRVLFLTRAARSIFSIRRFSLSTSSILNLFYASMDGCNKMNMAWGRPVAHTPQYHYFGAQNTYLYQTRLNLLYLYLFFWLALTTLRSYIPSLEQIQNNFISCDDDLYIRRV